MNETLSRGPRARAFAPLLLALALAATPAVAQQGRVPANPDGTPVPSLAPMLKRVSPAVVNIATRGTVAAPRNPLLEDPFFRRFFDVPPDQQPRQRQFQSAGSGVVIDAREGLIITNAHVVANATEITITTQDGRDFKAEVVGADAPTDVALLRVKGAQLVALAIGDSARAEVGDFVVAIGNPFGLQHTVTYGIVSGLGRTGLNPEGYEDFIQTDASINPGNSGGALVNLRGELIGVNSAILSRTGGNIGIGFAIPSNMVRAVADQLLKHGEVRRGVLGVNIVTLTPDIAENLGAREAQGALVSQVVEGSAAEKAGVRAGDIITAIDGNAVRTSAELRNRIGLLPIGQTVDLTLLREGREQRVRAVVQARAETEVASAEELHRALAGADLADAPNGGVLLRAVVQGSPAAQVGLRANDVIVSVNRRPVQNVRELRAVAKEQASLVLAVRRGNATLIVPIR